MTNEEAVKAYRRRLIVLVNLKHFHGTDLSSIKLLTRPALSDLREFMTKKDSTKCLETYWSHR